MSYAELPPFGQSKPCNDNACPWPKFEDQMIQDENDDECMVQHCPRCKQLVSLTILSRET